MYTGSFIHYGLIEFSVETGRYLIQWLVPRQS